MKLNPPFESRRVRTQPCRRTCLPSDSTRRASETVMVSIEVRVLICTFHRFCGFKMSLILAVKNSPWLSGAASAQLLRSFHPLQPHGQHLGDVAHRLGGAFV